MYAIHALVLLLRIVSSTHTNISPKWSIFVVSNFQPDNFCFWESNNQIILNNFWVRALYLIDQATRYEKK